MNVFSAQRTSWTAERIGHLLVKYESEWYADEALTKWNEIDELFEEEKDEKKEFMSKLLDGLGIDKEYLRKFAFDKVDEELEYIKRVWQIEKRSEKKPRYGGKMLPTNKPLKLRIQTTMRRH